VAKKGVENVVQWENITQGSDVFVNSMGTFDLLSAYKRIVDRRWRKHKINVLSDFLCAFDSFPPELEELSVSGLLDTCDCDELFHSVIASVIDEEIAANADAKNKKIDNLKESLCLGISCEDVERCDCFHGLPHWHVDMRDLWIEGCFPELTIGHNSGASEPILPSLRDTIEALYVHGPSPLEMDRRENIVCLLKADKDLPARRHFVNCLSGWKSCLATNADGFALDELAAFTKPRDCGDTAWPSNGMNLKPKALRNKLTLDFRFSHLDHLPDTPNLRVLRTLRDIEQVARDLENCAKRLVCLVRERRGIMVAFYDEDKSGQLTDKGATTLGLHTYDTDHLALDWCQIQMKKYSMPGKQLGESYTTHPTKKALDAYSKYRPTIKEWWIQNRKEDWFSKTAPRIDWSNLILVQCVLDHLVHSNNDLDEAIDKSIQDIMVDPVGCTYLDHLPDPRAPAPDHHFDLEVLRSKSDILYAFKDLGMPLNGLAQERRCIVVAYRDKNYDVTALGLYYYDREHLANDWIWATRKDSKDPPQDALMVYNEYKGMIKAWWKKHRKEEWF